MARSLAVAIALMLLGSPALADERVGEYPVNRTVDGAILAGAAAVALAPTALQLRSHGLWDTQLLGALDGAAIGQFSVRAGQMSDLMLGATIAAPAVYLTGARVQDSDGDRLVIYGETLAVDLALVQIAKYLVQRPRPYLYNQSEGATRFAQATGDDGWASFYSSHAAMSFGAAVAGAYLLGTTNAHPIARAMAWGTGLATATATANLRVRAGRHFYSDVLLGAVIGTTVGYVVPALHARGKRYSPDSNEIAAAGVGVFGGFVLSQLLPVEDGARREGAPAARPPVVMVDQVRVAPLALEDGAGLAISGRVRSRSWGRVPLSRRAVAAAGGGPTELR